MSSPTFRTAWPARLAALAALLLALDGPAGAQSTGDLVVVPKRVVFEGRDRATEITLINQSSETKTYRLLFSHMRMSESGQLQVAPEPAHGERPAADLIRFAPRRVVLEPGAVQTVRLQVRKPAELDTGEYRSHLVFRVIPPEDTGTSVEPASDAAFAVRLTPVYSVAIPVIVHHGELSGTVAVSSVDVRWDEKQARFRLERSGSRSFYGDLTATLHGPGGETVVVARAKGLAVYTPNTYRDVTLPLELPQERPRSGRLEIAFSASAEADDGLLASGEAVWP